MPISESKFKVGQQVRFIGSGSLMILCDNNGNMLSVDPINWCTIAVDLGIKDGVHYYEVEWEDERENSVFPESQLVPRD